MTEIREHTMHACSTLQRHLPVAARDRAAANAEMRPRTLRSRVETNVAGKSPTMAEVGLWLESGDITWQFLSDWAARYGIAVHAIEGFIESPACALTETQHWCADMAQIGEDGEYQQHEKRRMRDRIPKVIAALGGLYHQTKETVHICTRFYREHRRAAE